AAAREIFDEIIKQSGDRPEAAKAALRRGQSLKEEALLRVDAARKKLAQPNLKEEELSDARKKLAENLKLLGEAADYLVAQAEQRKDKETAEDTRARMLYDAAWGYREVGESEIAVARANLQQQRLKKLEPEDNKQAAAVIPVTEVSRADIKVQPSEAKAHTQ